MKPGRELDALVAKKVMGLHVFPDRSGIGYPADTTDEPGYALLREYSTNIAAAWEIMEKVDLLRSDKKPARMLTRQEDGWHVAIGDTGAAWEFTGKSVIGETAPHAICLAALRAVGVDV